MKLIENYEEISPLFRKYLKPGIKTNHFMSEEEYRLSIKDRLLSYHEWDGGIIFLKNRLDFFKITYQLTDLNKKIDIELPSNSVMEIVKRPSEKEESTVQNFWKEEGFNGILQRVRMTSNCGNVSKAQNDLNTFVNNEITIKLCMLNEKEKVMKLLKKSFSIYTGCIPSDAELENDLNNNLVLGAFNKDEKLVGVLHFSKKKGVSEIRHLAVDEEYRNMKIASMLISKYHDEFASEKRYLWVSENNEIAKKFYKKNGYVEDGWTSDVLANFKI